MRFDDFRESFWEPRKGPLVYTLVGFSLALSSSVWSSKVPPGSGMELLLQWGPLALIALMIVAGWLPRLFPVYLQEPLSSSGGAAARTRGLVVLASSGGGIETARHAVRYATTPERVLQWLWIVHSEASAEEALALKADLLRTGTLDDLHVRLLKLGDQDLKQPELVHDLIQTQVFERLPEGLGDEEVTIDLTGATKTATAGAFLAGLPPGRRMQVVPALTVDERNRGETPGDPIQIRIDYKLKRVRP